MVFDLSKTKSIANVFVAELRDADIQKDSMRFRRNLERLGHYFAFEISREFTYQHKEVRTPLGVASCQFPDQQPVLATILRAGLPLHQGMLEIFDRADTAFITAYRKEHQDGGFDIDLAHISAPALHNRMVILADPMLATGRSIVECCNALIGSQHLHSLHIVCAIASAEGVAYVRKHLPQARLWIGAIDEHMTAASYIVPGLGDAGDLAFGTKL